MERGAGRKVEWQREDGKAQDGRVVATAKEAKMGEEKGGKVVAKDTDTKGRALSVEWWGIRR